MTIARKTAAFLILSIAFLGPKHSFPSDLSEARDSLMSEDNPSGEIRLYEGKPRVFPVEKPTRVIIGNPEIADISSITDSEIVIMPKTEGDTTLAYWDTNGQESYRVRVQSADFTEVKSRIDNLLKQSGIPGVYSVLLNNENKILLKGQLKTDKEKEQIMSLLGKLKDKVVDLIQVKEEETAIDIAAEVFEIDTDATSTLGFTTPDSLTLDESITGEGFSKMFRISDWLRSPMRITLDLLVKQGRARILSRPKLACQSGKEAELMVGGEKPIFTTVITGDASGTEVEYKEYGIKLKIKPTIMDNERIKINLDMGVSEVGEEEFIGASNNRTAQAFPLTKRTVTTELFMNDGQTLGIGGLVKQKTEEDIHKTAFLGDIPVLGALFRSKSTKEGDGATRRGNVELIVLLTPKIIRTPPPITNPMQLRDTTGPLPAQLTAPKDLNGYRDMVKRYILDNFTYPGLAKEAGFEGTVKLSLHFSYMGELLEAVVKESSGFSMLDQHALNIVRSVSTYPPFPPSVQNKDIWIDIPIVYSLN